MKLYRNAIILVVVLAFLIGATVLISKTKGSDTSKPQTSTKTINVMRVDSGKVNEIIIKNKEDQLLFGKDKNDWILKSPKGVKTVKGQIASFVTGITGLTADSVIGEKVSDLTQYGLDHPTAEIVLKTSDSKIQTLELGGKTFTKEDYYVLDKEKNTVYTINTQTGDRFLNARNEIRDKALFTSKTEDIKGLSMERDGKLVFMAKIAADKSWNLVAPFEANANMEGLNPMIDAISKMTVSNFIEDNAPNLDKYGLQNPAYTFEIQVSSGKSKIMLGSKKVDGTQMYAKMDNSKDVFTIDSSSLDFLDKPFREMISSFVYLAKIEDVSQIAVTMDGQTTVSTIQANKDKKGEYKYTVNGKGADIKDAKGEKLFDSYYQALIGITFDDLDTGNVPAGKPEITFTYTLNKAPGTMKVEFIPKDNNDYYVVKNGKYSHLIVQKNQFNKSEGVRDTYKKLMDALNKK